VERSASSRRSIERSRLTPAARSYHDAVTARMALAPCQIKASEMKNISTYVIR
jgi:hypothetical protein